VSACIHNPEPRVKEDSLEGISQQLTINIPKSAIRFVREQGKKTKYGADCHKYILGGVYLYDRMDVGELKIQVYENCNKEIGLNPRLLITNEYGLYLVFSQEGNQLTLNLGSQREESKNIYDSLYGRFVKDPKKRERKEEFDLFVIHLVDKLECELVKRN